ncbi:glycosyltransferase [Polynucleobacter paneuropaeus]|nr:glycosyltransferase [Polynucleobacter paneuropaeus]MBT8530964.1 glycosyltransferase [Polynucleobacter paneuropaeus]MBT8602479.1 glycosyltransferase [Polynucleobacter paneuropaeus]MBT8624432.1 glycosyltransferase [Polynucleobacter paneuropaeus]MBT8628683.1 glycosyltransferase [Polynucleobacter paneuropaeus]
MINALNSEFEDPWSGIELTGVDSALREACTSNSIDINLPRISIVIPTYQAGKLLERTIRSILLQNYPNIDLILMDGGSSDESIEVINYYKDFFSHWRSEKDQGQSDAINMGMTKATGAICGWLNADDIYYQHGLWHIAEGYIESRQSDIILGIGSLVDINFNLINEQHYEKIGPEAFKDYRKNYIIQPGCFFSKKAWDLCGPVKLELNYAMDFDLFMRMSQHFNIFLVKKRVAFSVFHVDCKTVKDRVKSIVETALLEIEFGAPEIAKRELMVIADEHKFLENKFNENKDKKNILFLITELNVGGAQTFIIRLMRELARFHNIFLCILDPTNVSEKMLSLLPPGVKNISHLSIQNPINFSLILDLLKIDLIHSNLYHADKFLSDCVDQMGIKTPWVLCDHGDYKLVEKVEIAKRQDIVKILSNTSRIVTTAKKEVDTFLKYEKSLSKKIIPITLCVDEPVLLSPELVRKGVRSDLNIPEDDFVLACGARGIPEKGWMESIESVLLAAKKSKKNGGKNIHLLCLGESDYLKELEEGIKQNEFCKNIHFLGYQKNTTPYFVASDLGIMLTTYPAETLNLFAIEMLSLGKPVIASNWGSLDETLGVGDYTTNLASNQLGGLLIELVADTKKPSIEGAANAILDYINDDALYAMHSQFAFKAFQKFSVISVVEKYNNLFKEIA